MEELQSKLLSEEQTVRNLLEEIHSIEPDPTRDLIHSIEQAIEPYPIKDFPPVPGLNMIDTEVLDGFYEALLERYKAMSDDLQDDKRAERVIEQAKAELENLVHKGIHSELNGVNEFLGIQQKTVDSTKRILDEPLEDRVKEILGWDIDEHYKAPIQVFLSIARTHSRRSNKFKRLFQTTNQSLQNIFSQCSSFSYKLKEYAKLLAIKRKNTRKAGDNEEAQARIAVDGFLYRVFPLSGLVLGGIGIFQGDAKLAVGSVVAGLALATIDYLIHKKYRIEVYSPKILEILAEADKGTELLKEFDRIDELYERRHYTGVWTIQAIEMYLKAIEHARKTKSVSPYRLIQGYKRVGGYYKINCTYYAGIGDVSSAQRDAKGLNEITERALELKPSVEDKVILLEYQKFADELPKICSDARKKLEKGNLVR